MREPVAAPAPPPDVPLPVAVRQEIETPAPSAAVPPHIDSAPAPAAPIPSLAEAFAALLSAEHGRRLRPRRSGPPVSDEKIDEIVRRVVASMADRTIRDTVVDVAERLVREEIERIKQGQ